MPILPGQTPPPPVQAAAAMNAGLQHLKDSQWQQATESFDLAVMLAPAYAPAYVGKLCAELTVTEETLLGDLTVGIDEHPFFKSALEHADPAYKQQIQGYADSINARVKAMMNSVKDTDDQKASSRTVLNINDVEYAFRWCPAGTFVMGSPQDGAGGKHNMKLHRVVLSRGFWLLETEVTQMMWASVMGNNPSNFTGMKQPVDSVSWYDCQEYIKQLNGLSIVSKEHHFSLPTEAQWEYACRAGTTTPFHFGDTLERDKGNFGGNVGKTSDVGSYPANSWGLHDMHGNVCEWCLDRYGDYPNGAVIDPAGAVEGSYHVLRGVAWNCLPWLCRSADRYYLEPQGKNNGIGLRLALVCDEER